MNSLSCSSEWASMEGSTGMSHLMVRKCNSWLIPQRSTRIIWVTHTLSIQYWTNSRQRATNRFGLNKISTTMTETVTIFLEGENGLRKRQGWLKHCKEEDERFVVLGVGEKNASCAEQPLPGKIKTCYCWLYKKPNNRDTNFSFSGSFMCHFITECCTQRFASCSPFMLHKKIILWWSAEDKFESLTAWG